MTSQGSGGIDGDALAVDARLTDIERELNLLLGVTPTSSAEAWTDFDLICRLLRDRVEFCSGLDDLIRADPAMQLACVRKRYQ